jgi:hypothetical protein
MKIPTMAPLSDRKLEIQPFGGLNTSKLDTEIDDNQMSDVNNFYYKNKLLSMRPGLIKQIEQTYGKIVDVCLDENDYISTTTITMSGDVWIYNIGYYILTKNNIIYLQVRRGVVSDEYIREVTYYWSDGTAIANADKNYDFSNCHLIKSNISSSNSISGSTSWHSKGTQVMLAGNGYFFIISDYLVYVSPSLSTVFTLETGAQLIYTKKITTSPTTNVIKPFAPHAPVILTNMAPSGKGDALESRNYLTSQCQCEFITNNVDKIYNLPDKTIDNTDVTITYNDLTGDPSWEIHGLFTFGVSETVRTNGTITATLDRTLGIITFSVVLTNGAAKQAAVPNMTVQYAKTIYADPNPILKCNIAAWFGGSYQGLTSGDSVFLSGNPDEPNAVYWSAVKDLTYFPINNTDYVGSPSDPITAFGKAFSKLVILKQNSVYEKGFSWDSANSKAYFPTSEIHVGIGCDMPKSVQLVANNLTWGNTKGGVYTLTTTSTTSNTSNISTERVIQPLSQNINNEILSNILADLQNAVSVDNGSYYILFVGKNVYLWDYNTTSFINYLDTIKLQNRLAWYRWTIPHAFTTAFLYGGKIWGSALENNFLYAFDEIQPLDDGSVWFEVYLYSKTFDNGVPERLKQVNKIWLSLSSVNYMTVEGLLIDEYGEQTELIDIDNNNTVSPFKLSLSSEWTQQYKVGVRRIEGDNGVFGLNKFIINAKIGRLI